MKFKTNVMKHLFCVLCVSILFIGCSAEDGNDGAMGPQGIDGTDGVDGTDGSDGETGTANVIYSDWIASDFADPITDDFDQWEIFAPELTQEIHDTGVILVYARVGTLIYPIPVTFFSTIRENWNFRLLDINDTLIAIRVNSTDGGVIGTPFLNEDFRYIIIPGGTTASTDDGRSATINYSKMSYEEIIAHFNIPE